MSITIIICTRNRCEILKECLEKLVLVESIRSIDELVVIDNNSDDLTKEIVTNFNSVIPIRYYNEKKIGLSYARNTGMKLSSSEWLFYLDDDALLNSDGINQILGTIANYSFDFFTGVYEAWYKYGKPKWLPLKVGNYQIKGKTNSIRPLAEDYIAGCVMVIKKSLLFRLGGFPLHLGMSGNKIAYAEETFIEKKARELNYSLGINPFLIIDHLVPKHKMTISWILKSEFAKGRDLYYLRYHKGKSDLVRKILSVLFRPIFNFFPSFITYLKKDDYYIQNFIIDWLSPIFFQAGKIKAILSVNRNHE